jgi:hypothetical protein
MRAEAEGYEARSQWARAAEVYCKILASDRSDQDARDRYQNCLRHIYQARRLRDAAFQRDILSRKLASALDIYEEILKAVKDYYVDERKATPALLFQYGVQEFRFALEDPEFVQTHLSRLDAEKIRGYAANLTRWLDRSVASIADARQLVQELALDAVAELQIGEAVVVLELAYGASNALDEYTVSLTPKQYKELTALPAGKTVESAELLPTTGVGYMKVVGFNRNTIQEMKEAILGLAAKGMRVLVLDLRDNGGGSFRVAIDASELFLHEGVIATTQSRLKEFDNKTYKANNPSAFDIPLVVLVNGETASAAEVFAAAIKENHRRARLIGRTTYGKNTMQCLVEVKHLSSGMRITVARFFPSSKQDFGGRGILPDQAVKDSASPEEELAEAESLAGILLSMIRD